MASEHTQWVKFLQGENIPLLPLSTFPPRRNQGKELDSELLLGACRNPADYKEVARFSDVSEFVNRLFSTFNELLLIGTEVLYQTLLDLVGQIQPTGHFKNWVCLYTLTRRPNIPRDFSRISQFILDIITNLNSCLYRSEITRILSSIYLILTRVLISVYSLDARMIFSEQTIMIHTLTHCLLTYSIPLAPGEEDYQTLANLIDTFSTSSYWTTLYETSSTELLLNLNKLLQQPINSPPTPKSILNATSALRVILQLSLNVQPLINHISSNQNISTQILQLILHLTNLRDSHWALANLAWLATHRTTYTNHDPPLTHTLIASTHCLIALHILSLQKSGATLIHKHGTQVLKAIKRLVSLSTPVHLQTLGIFNLACNLVPVCAYGHVANPDDTPLQGIKR